MPQERSREKPVHRFQPCVYDAIGPGKNYGYPCCDGHSWPKIVVAMRRWGHGYDPICRGGGGGMRVKEIEIGMELRHETAFLTNGGKRVRE